jgi:septum site-determining protein MinC
MPLVALLLKSGNWTQVANDLSSQFGPKGETPDFFDNDGLVLDFSGIGLADGETPNFENLLQSLIACRLKVLAFRNATPAQAKIAFAHGLIEVPAVAAPNKGQRKNAETPSSELATPVAQVTQALVREVAKGVLAATLVIDKPLRSGQKIYARGADLVVLAMVNMGAEVVADGNIHVYAPLRGKAMAGASGNTQARIFSLCMEPELISIAGVYRTSENKLPTHIQGKTAQVRLSDDGQEKLLFEALNT